MYGDKWLASKVFVPTGLIVFLYVTYRFITRNNDYFAKRNVPYVKPTLVFGNTLRVFIRKVSVHDSVIELYSQLDGHKIGGIFQLMKPVYLVRDPEIIRHVTVKDFEHFVDLPIFIPEDTDPILTKILPALKGKWTTF
jgi:cytochrome P450 family 9